MKKPTKKKNTGGRAQSSRPPRPRIESAPFHERETAEGRIQARKPELLAPAGSLASWAAAVEAGADAVYLGLKDFSARAYAANFSLADLARIVPLSREQGVKVFVAFNSILKENDLPQAASILDALTRIGPDALIIQDLGLRRLVKEHFPELELHASTLMAAHNLSGMQVLAGLGFQRAVAARELTLSEIEGLAAHSPIPLEMFIHGAMCFSFSGLCLMSSFLGGKGSLRGACTQPCRRRYSSGKKTGFFFSPTDLEAVDIFGRLRELPLAALKIEGRMKGPDYVSNVVRAYRLLLDVPMSDMEQAVEDAGAMLEASLGRQRSTGFFLGPHPQAGLSPRMAATSGLFVGQFSDGGEKGGRLLLKEPLSVGDRLRIQFKKDDERTAYTLKEMKADGLAVDTAAQDQEVFIATTEPVAAGDLVFKVGASGSEQDALASPLVQAFREMRKENSAPSPRLKAIQESLKTAGRRSGGTSRKPEVWYRVGRAEEVAGLVAVKPDRVILPVTRPNVRRISALRRRLGPLFERLVWSLPPLVFHANTPALRSDLSQLVKMGAREFMIANLGHLPLLDAVRPAGRGRGMTIFADYRLNCLNTQTERQLAELGLDGVTWSIEDDETNLAAVLSSPGPVQRLLYLYGRPPLFTSRFVPSGLKDNLPVESPKLERFRLKFEAENVLMFAERPIFLAPLLKFKNLAGVRAFLVDLEFDPRPAVTAKEISEAISRGKPIRSASRFNLNRGLY